MWQQTRMQQLNSRKFSRKRLRPESGKLVVTKEDAEHALTMKLQHEKKAEKKREDNKFMKICRMERDEIHVKGMAARKVERDRVKRLKEMTKTLNPIPIELY